MKGVIQKTDARYPKLLLRIQDPPKQLYFKGNWDAALFEHCLAVVGARRMTGYGKRVVDSLVFDIAEAGITIVSGFMYGVDAAAHASALRAGGKTIAVMPCGIDRVHPEHQKELHESITRSGGLIVSEFPGNMQPSNWTYPRRNRIVAGLSQATLVVEASQRSGSLITARLAKEYDRKLFAVPGTIISELSSGTNQLLREGADWASCAGDIVRFFHIPFQQKQKSSVCSMGLESRVMRQLRQEPMEIDVLARNLGISVARAGMLLSVLQLRGSVALENRVYYPCS